MTGRPGPWWRASRRLAVTVAVGTVLGTGVLGAAPAQAAVYDCTPMGTPVCRAIEPVAECVWDNGDGSRTALWGWDNPMTDTARIDVGNKNAMSPGPDDQGQPTLLAPGRNRNVFTTTFTGSGASWRLGNNTAKIDTTVPACATKPVPQVGNAGAVLIGCFILIVGGLLLAAARPRHQVVLP